MFSLDLDENNMTTEIEKSQVQFIADIKERVSATQYEVLKIVKVQLINLYWELSRIPRECKSRTIGSRN